MPGELLRYPFTEDGLTEALKALGTTPQAVATNLSALGFSGKVNEPLCCPVANYLRTSVEGATEACVGKGDDNALFAQCEQRSGLETLASVDEVSVPAAVTAFVEQFDARLFPDLIEEGIHAR